MCYTDISTLVSQYFDVDVGVVVGGVIFVHILPYFKLIDFDTFLALRVCVCVCGVS